MLHYVAEEILIYRQEFRGKKTEFEFAEKYVQYHFSDSDESIEFKVPYEQIDIDFPIKHREKNVIWKFVTIPFWFLAIMTFGKAVVISESSMQLIAGILVMSIWLSMVGICYWLYKRGQISFTIFDSSKGKLIIIDDNQQQNIINEIDIRVNSARLNLNGNMH
ncbi:hypothetical protein ACMZOO_18410 (plasmid) [Catenovulum sp. SX2]|uniref:hypothetical protein n=1 Tax=Catenovulum sp. SX2 TaxID=3398614 RepID=UPI003F86A9B3